MLVAVYDGLLADLNALTRSWKLKLWAGLFQNPDEPQRDWTIARIQPANFGGYVGLQQISSWTPAALFGDVAISQAAGMTWTMTSAAPSNWIFGYYVVDALGVLRWAEQRPGPPRAMIVVGNTYQVIPKFSLGSEFP